MYDLLRKYIVESLAEVQGSPRVANQLIPKGGNGKKKEEESEEAENESDLDEMNVAANIAGFTGPLGASADDMGKNPVRPGGKLKKRKKNFVRWK